jgi:2-methylcitrate dehydratase
MLITFYPVFSRFGIVWHSLSRFVPLCPVLVLGPPGLSHICICAGIKVDFQSNKQSMAKPFQTELMADFALNTTWDDIPAAVVDQLKKHLLDAFASLIYALPTSTMQKLYRQIQFFGEGGNCKVPVLGNIALDRAAQVYTGLIRYPDFMDNFLGKKATCHPSDNIGSLLAIGQMNNASGKELLTAIAIAYQMECRLMEEVPVMENGFDHTTLLAHSLSASASRLLGLSKEQTMHAISIAACAFDPMVTCRASYTFEWKGFASSSVAQGVVNGVILAKENMTGPISFFDGPKGFKEIHDMELKYDWTKENFELIPKCILKIFNSEVHTQSLLECIIELREEPTFINDDIEEIEVTTFLTNYHITGGGAYGNRHIVTSKEQADHSTPYVVAVALLDGEVYPPQFTDERINREDVQQLLQKVKVKTGIPIHKPINLAGVLDPYTVAYPDKVKAKVVIKTKDGKSYEAQRDDYKGFFTRPLSWDDVAAKFKRLTSDVIDEKMQDEFIDIIQSLEKHNATALTGLLNEIKVKLE